MIEFDSVSDEELINLLRNEDKHEADAIMDYLLEKYKPLVRKKTNVLFIYGGENDDLVQEGMIGLFKAVRDFNPAKESSFYHFAEICINRQIYTALEASNRKKHAPLNSYISISESNDSGNGEIDELLLTNEDSNPENWFIRNEQWEEFRKNLWKKLSKMEQCVLQLYLEGIPYTKIAEQLDKTPKSIDNTLQRIKSKSAKLKAGE